MKENFTATQKEVVARKMGYDGPMQMFDEFLMSRPSDAQRYASITSKFAENMAKGGMVGYKNLASKGRYGDTMLAHVNPEEAALLKARGGAGTINPQTGLREFWQDASGNTVGMPTKPNIKSEYMGGRNFRETVIEPFDRHFADTSGGGMGVYKITGYTVPTDDKKYANIPLDAKYDAQGNFKFYTLKAGEAITPDPNQPNIISVPRLNALGEVEDWGIVDTNNQDNGSFGSFIRGLASDFGPMILAGLGANALTGFGAAGAATTGGTLAGMGTGAAGAAATTAAQAAIAAEAATAATAAADAAAAATTTTAGAATTGGTLAGMGTGQAGVLATELATPTVQSMGGVLGGGSVALTGGVAPEIVGGITVPTVGQMAGPTLADAVKGAKDILDVSKEGGKENSPNPKDVSGAIGLLLGLLGERNASTRGKRNYVNGGDVTLTPDIARSLMDRTTTVGVSNAELDKYGGYGAVKAMFNANEGSSTSSTGGSPSTTGNPQLGTQSTAAIAPTTTTRFTDAMKAAATQPAALKTASAQPDVVAQTATAPEKVVADTITADKAQTTLTTALKDVSAETGSVSEGAKAAAATVTPTTTDVGKDAAATGTATAVKEPTDRVLQTGEQVSGSAVDQEQVKQALAKTEAAQGTVTEDMTTQGQLNKLLTNFDAGNPPPWAAASMRSVTAQLAARGLGASSIAGQAIVQATLEAALPIAATDAKVFEQMGLQNLSNKQQTAMILGEQRAKFLGQEFDQSFQAKVLNAARIADIADKNFTADVTIALENARITSTMDLQNLSNKQALILAKTAQVANLETANLSNKQQVAVENAKAFLTLDVKNLDNKQQVALFKGKEIADSILTDTAASNAIKATNASNALDASKVNAQLAFSASQFNAAEKNKVAIFNKSAAEEISKFNAQQENQRSEFNANLSTQISVANAKLLADVSMANTRETNAMAAVNAKNATDLSASTYAQLSQTYRDQLETTWKTAENVKDRANDIAKVTLTTEATKYAGDAAADAAYYAALGSLSVSLLNSAGGSKVVSSLLDKGIDTVLGWFD